MLARQQQNIAGLAKHLFVGFELLQERVELTVLGVGLVTDAVGLGLGFLAGQLGVRLGICPNDLRVSFGVGSDLAGLLLSGAFVLSRLPLSLAADAFEDGRPHA